MKFLLPLALLATVTAAPALADCVEPTIAITVPDGSTAVIADMIAAQHAIKDADAVVQQYANCLKAEQEAV